MIPPSVSILAVGDDVDFVAGHAIARRHATFMRIVAVVPARPFHPMKSLELFLQSGDKRANPRMIRAAASLKKSDGSMSNPIQEPI